MSMERGIITISEGGVVSMPTAPIWMTQFEIADLFGVFSCDVRKAIHAIYKNGELNEADTMKYVRQKPMESVRMFTALKWLLPLHSEYAVRTVCCSDSL